jgi:hypothetical protein
MAITTRSNKEKPISQATVATVATPVVRHPNQCAKRLAWSPHTSSVNIHLADINRPKTRIDSVLQALQPNRYAALEDPNLNSDVPGYLSPSIEKGILLASPDLLTGVDVQDGAPQATAHNVSPQESNTLETQPTPRSRSIRISDTIHTANTIGGVTQGTANSPETATRQLILMTSSRTAPTDKDPHKEDDEDPPTDERLREIYDRDRKLYHLFSEDGMKETAYHVTDFANFYPVWQIVEFSMAPTGATKDERMTLFIKCVTALLGKMLYLDDTAMIAPIDITDNKENHFLKSKADIPSNFTKLGKHIMIGGGSWVFTKKEKGSNDVYRHFRLKSQIPTEDIINRVSLEFSRIGGKNIFKKQHQVMETETPLMLLFVCNRTDQSSILSDTRQMLDLPYDDIESNRMMPEKFENKNIPEYSLQLNVTRLPSDTKKNNNKAFDHYREQGKKAFHFKVAKEDVAFFKFLSGHAHQLRLDNKFFRKFAKFTATLSNNAPLSNCVSLRRCIQGHLNFHLSSTSITIHGIDALDASEVLRNAADKKTIAKFTLRDLLYHIRLKSNAPLFVQLSQ